VLLGKIDDSETRISGDLFVQVRKHPRTPLHITHALAHIRRTYN